MRSIACTIALLLLNSCIFAQNDAAPKPDRDIVPKGRLQGQLVNGTFIGNWTPDSSDRADPVRVVAIQKPACDGSGAWKRFDDPKWPVSFSYPVSWHIQQNDDVLELICPDPEVMTYDARVTIYEGKDKGKPVGPWELMHCAGGWQFGPSCDDNRSDIFGVAEVSHQPGKTILDITNEWRVYCSDGGYRGQGDGENRAVLLDGSWIEFIGAGQTSDIDDRLVKSARVRTAPGSRP